MSRMIYALAFGGVTLSSAITFQRIIGDMNRRVEHDVNYLQEMRDRYILSVARFSEHLPTKMYYENLLHLTEEQIAIRNEWKEKPVLRRLFSQRLHLSDAVMDIERTAAERSRVQYEAGQMTQPTVNKT